MIMIKHLRTYALTHLRTYALTHLRTASIALFMMTLTCLSTSQLHAQCDEPSGWDAACNNFGELNNSAPSATEISGGVYFDFCLTDGDDDWYYIPVTGDPNTFGWYFRISAVEDSETVTKDCGYYNLIVNYDTSNGLCDIYTEPSETRPRVDTYLELYRAVAPNSIVYVTADDNSGEGHYSRLDSFCIDNRPGCFDIISITENRITFYLPTHPNCSFSDYYLLVDGMVVNWFFTYDLSLGEWIGWVDNLDPCTTYTLSLTAICKEDEYFNCSEVFTTQCPPSPITGIRGQAPRKVIYLDQPTVGESTPPQMSTTRSPELLISPSPAKDVITLQWQGLFDLGAALDIRVYGIDGQEVYCPILQRGQQSARLDVSALTHGMYLAVLNSASGERIVEKFAIAQ